ncbi:hypothetical protein BH24DEI2_BH24DEI2_06580 [soil metagenome]
MTPFGTRIQERHRTFWTEPHRGIHDAETCCNELLTRDDPFTTWHCCPLWQRKLSNKWNAREFAAKVGCQVPDLYWHGRGVANLDFATLPSHYVVRPTLGHSSKGIFVMADGTNLLDGNAYSENELKKQLAEIATQDPRVTILLEEFVKSEDGEYRLPTDYKLLMFDGRVGAVGAIRRLSRKNVKKRYYTESWGQFSEPIIVPTADKVRDDIVAPPRCLPDILVDAKRLSKAYGTFVRLDFYATDRGSVFGEFTPTPALGRNFTDFASRHFLELWEEAYPEPDGRKVSA